MMPDDETFTLPQWNDAPNPGSARSAPPETPGLAPVESDLPLLLVGSGSAEGGDLELAAADATRQAIGDLGLQLDARGLGDLAGVQVSLMRRKNTVVAIAVGRARPIR